MQKYLARIAEKKFLRMNESFPVILVTGARQIGKTYSIRKFIKSTDLDILEFNLELENNITELFEQSIDPDIILHEIELIKGQKIDIEHTILFFDEVQVSERFITSLKYFNESEKSFKIICAGSLLGVKLNRFRSSFPVGKVRMLNIYPMDFEEFLLACGLEMARDAIKQSFITNKAINSSVHDMLLKKYREYLYVGGMPAAVKNFIENNQELLLFDTMIQLNILDAYTNDMTKYLINMSEAVRNEQIYNSIPAQLSQEKSKKFKYSLVEVNGSKRKFESSLSWLISGHMLLEAKLVKRAENPLMAFAENGYFKLYFSDVGLLSAKTGQNINGIMDSKNNLFFGALTENFVAQQFVSSKIPLFYWTSGNTAEIDFLISGENGVIPVEVKSGNNTRSKSLSVFVDKYDSHYSIRISSKNFGFENKIKSVPLYAVWCIKPTK